MFASELWKPALARKALVRRSRVIRWPIAELARWNLFGGLLCYKPSRRGVTEQIVFKFIYIYIYI